MIATSGLSMAMQPKDVLRCACSDNGAQCVMTAGEDWTP